MFSHPQNHIFTFHANNLYLYLHIRTQFWAWSNELYRYMIFEYIYTWMHYAMRYYKYNFIYPYKFIPWAYMYLCICVWKGPTSRISTREACYIYHYHSWIWILLPHSIIHIYEQVFSKLNGIRQNFMFIFLRIWFYAFKVQHFVRI